MKQLKSYRMDERTLKKLNGIGEYLSMNNTEILEALVAFGYDLLVDVRCADDTDLTVGQFLDSLNDRMRMNKPNRW